MTTIQERSRQVRIKSRYERVSERVRALLRGCSDLQLGFVPRGPALTTIEIMTSGRLSQLTDIHLRQINQIKEVIGKEFPSRFPITCARYGTRRVQMHIPLL